MTIPAGFPYPLNQVVEIPLEQIIPNPDQPRRSIRKDTLEELASSMRVKGQEVPAPVRPLTEAEKASNPGVWVMLVGGHRRRLAALMNEFETLKCIVRDLTPEETHSAAVTDNLHDEMDWWDWDLAIEKEALSTHKSQAELEGWMGKSRGKVYKALTITKALNEAARALVDENLEKNLKNDGSSRASKNKGFLITEQTLLALADLEDPGQVQQALQVVLDDYLTTDQAQKLVEHIRAGHPADTFNPHQAVPKAPKTKPAETPSHAEVPNPHPVNKPDQPATHTPQPETPATQATAGQMSEAETMAWDTLAGVSVISQIKAKIKKGQRPSLGETVLLVGHYLGRGLVWLGKKGFQLGWHLLKLLWKVLKGSVRTIGKVMPKKGAVGGFFKVLKAGFAVALLALFGWILWDGYTNGITHPFEVLSPKVDAAQRFLMANYDKGQKLVAAQPSKPTAEPTPAQALVPTAASVPTTVPTIVSAKAAAPTPITTAPTPTVAADTADNSPVGEKEVSPSDSTAGTQPLQNAVVQPTLSAANTAPGNTTPSPTATVITVQATPTAHTDVAGQIVKQAAPGLAVDAAKKLFGL